MKAVALKDPLIRKRYWNIDPGCVEGKNIFGASERDVEDQYEWGPNTMLMGLHYKVRSYWIAAETLFPAQIPMSPPDKCRVPSFYDNEGTMASVSLIIDRF